MSVLTDTHRWETPVNLSLAPPATSELASALSALSTAGCLVDAGPVPGLAYARCADDDGCPAVGSMHVTYADATADVDAWREGDWCAAHVRGEVLYARERTSYVDCECRTPVTAGTEAAA
jgi:hypothetical protein